MRTGLLLLSFLLAGAGHGQLLDSIALFIREPARPVVRLDVKGAFVSNQNVRLLGVKVGVEHARRFQYGLGYSFLFTEVVREREVHGLGSWPTRLRMGYVHAFLDHAFYQRGPWEVRIPVQIGVGTGSVVYDDPEGARRTLYRSGVVVYEPAMTVQYRFLNYFGVGAGWGYRLVMRTRHSLDERLTAPIYTLGLRIFFEDIYRDLKGRGT